VLKSLRNFLSNAHNVFIVFTVVINLAQAGLVIAVGLYFGTLIQVGFLTLIFMILKEKTKHFPIIMCTLLTVTYYIIASFIINNFILVSFMPIILGLWLVYLSKEE